MDKGTATLKSLQYEKKPGEAVRESCDHHRAGNLEHKT